MQIYFFSSFVTAVADVIIWVILHLGIGYLCSVIPIQKITIDRSFYQTQSWEKEGGIYQRLFKVRDWKKFIPQGSKLYRNDFSLQHIDSFDPAYLERWLKESVRAEFCHWVMMIPGFFFFLWNSFIGGIGMIFYAILVNLFPIILQRFNRPRIRRMLEQARIKQGFYKNNETNAFLVNLTATPNNN
ncbi:MAG: hypothetical protein WAW52_01875 [Methanothrix sp.]